MWPLDPLMDELPMPADEWTVPLMAFFIICHLVLPIWAAWNVIDGTWTDD